MIALRWIIAVAATALVMPAHAATSDPETIIYRVTGVVDNGGASGTGFATVFNCTNLSPVVESIRFVVRNFNSVIAANAAFSVGSLQTVSVSTHFTVLFAGFTLSPGTSLKGTTVMAATSTNIFCSAMIVDAGAATASAIAATLPMVRFSPMAGTEE